MKDSVLKWRPAVEQELSAAGYPFPIELVLAVIHVESRGKAGLVNSKSGASGLMQVMPKTLEWYNQRHGKKITLEQLRSPNFGLEQIRVGIWVMGQFWRSAYKYLSKRFEETPVEELAKIADLFYVAGPGATQKRLDKLENPTFEAVAAKWPDWNALPHPRNVFKQLDETPPYWDLESISAWLKGNITKTIKVENLSFLVLGIVFIIYWYYLKNGGK